MSGLEWVDRFTETSHASPKESSDLLLDVGHSEYARSPNEFSEVLF